MATSTDASTQVRCVFVTAVKLAARHIGGTFACPAMASLRQRRRGRQADRGSAHGAIETGARGDGLLVEAVAEIVRNIEEGRSIVSRTSASATAALFLAVLLVAVLFAPASARGEVAESPSRETGCFIRIGPQALVYRDRGGKLSMVDEPSAPMPAPSAAGAMVGAFLGAALGTFVDDPRRVLPGVTYGMVAGGAEGDLTSMAGTEGSDPETLPLCGSNRRVR
jgi:hypothetical protein